MQLPDFVPYPLVAGELFQYVKLPALAVGLLVAIILFFKSKTKGFKGIFWSKRFVSVLITFVVVYFAYYMMFTAIDTPSIPLIYFEAFMYFLIYFVMTIVVTLVIVLAPKRLIEAIKDQFP